MPQSPIYRVIETGEIGRLIPCPCDNPVILEFKDGIRDAFFLRELEPIIPGLASESRSIGPALGTEGADHLITVSYPTRGSATKNRVKGRPKGLERRTVEKMLQIYRFLETQSEPVYRSAIEKAVGFNCTRPLMSQPSQPKQVTLERLGIAERLPGERTWVTWQLTELGRARGAKILNDLGSETEGADMVRGLK